MIIGQNDGAQVTELRQLDGSSRIFDLVMNGRPLAEHRNNALLSKDQWQELDDAVVQASRDVLNITQDLRDNGLVRELGNIGILQAQYENIDDLGAAETSLDGESSGAEQTNAYTLKSIPVPVIHKDFRISARRLEASRRNGRTPLDVTGADSAARQVAEKIENMITLGDSTISIGGTQVDGLKSFSNVVSDSAAGDWGTEGNAYDTVRSMIGSARNNNFRGPYMLYVHENQLDELNQRFTDGSGQTERQAINENLGELGLMDIKELPDLSDGEVYLVQMTRNVIELGLAEDIQTVQWESPSGMSMVFRVMAIMTPIIKENASSKTGIVEVTDA